MKWDWYRDPATTNYLCNRETPSASYTYVIARVVFMGLTQFATYVYIRGANIDATKIPNICVRVSNTLPANLESEYVSQTIEAAEAKAVKHYLVSMDERLRNFL